VPDPDLFGAPKEGVLAQPQLLNRYAYCVNNPLKYNDPTGNHPEWPSYIPFFGVGYTLGEGLYHASGFSDNSSFDPIDWSWRMRDACISTFAMGMIMYSAGYTGSERIGGEASSAEVTLKLTAHGSKRIDNPQATRGGVLTYEEIITTRSMGRTFTQADGATVRVLGSNSGKYNVVIESERGIITTFKNITQKSFDKLGRKYGWKE